MAYDEDLADRIRELLAAEAGVIEKKMFGGLAFLIGGHMAVAASGQGGLMARVAPEETDACSRRSTSGRSDARPPDGRLAARRRRGDRPAGASSSPG